MKPGAFCQCAFAKFIPLFLDGNWIDFRNLPEGKLKTTDALIRLTRHPKRFRKNGLNCVELAH